MSQIGFKALQTLVGKCPFDDKELCLRTVDSTCAGCQIWKETADEFCPMCGADLQVWKEVFGEEHQCKR
jgi:hypothetical protein